MKFLLSLLLVFSVNVNAQDFSTAIASNQKLISDFVQTNKIPGLSIAICWNGNIIWTQGFGYANLELNVPAKPDTKYRIASLSKSVTGTAIAKLVDKGLINLNDPVTKYLSDVPATWDSITIYNVCEHSSGIAHYKDIIDQRDTTFYSTTNDALNVFKNRPLLHSPGLKRTYSSYAYTVLAAIIEKVSGKSFLKFIQEDLFIPLEMKNTMADMKRDIIPQRSAYYSYNEKNEIVFAQYVDNSSRWAGTGMLSTVTDLALFGAAHCKPGFLSQKMLDLINTPRQLKDGNTASETLAWGPRKDWEGRSMLWNNGGTPGCTGGLLIFPKQNLSIAMLCNINSAPFDRGEIQAIALRFLASIEGNKVETIPASEKGSYNLTVTLGGKDYKASLELNAEQNSITGFFEIEGLQKFIIADVFKINDKTWIIALGEKDGLFGVGILPLRIEIKNNAVEGSILRVDGIIKGKKKN